VNTRIALAMTKNNQLFITEYCSKMRSLVDDMATPNTVARCDPLLMTWRPPTLLFELMSLCPISFQDLMKITTLFTTLSSHTSSSSHQASCMCRSLVLSSTSSCRMDVSLATLCQLTWLSRSWHVPHALWWGVTQTRSWKVTCHLQQLV
jgi:hypothetical protein